MNNTFSNVSLITIHNISQDSVVAVGLVVAVDLEVAGHPRATERHPAEVVSEVAPEVVSEAVCRRRHMVLPAVPR